MVTTKVRKSKQKLENALPPPGAALYCFILWPRPGGAICGSSWTPDACRCRYSKGDCCLERSASSSFCFEIRRLPIRLFIIFEFLILSSHFNTFFLLAAFTSSEDGKFNGKKYNCQKDHHSRHAESPKCICLSQDGTIVRSGAAVIKSIFKGRRCRLWQI